MLPSVSEHFEKLHTKINRCRKSQCEDCEGEVPCKTGECQCLTQQAEVTRTSADAEGLTSAGGEFLRSGPKPLSSNYCLGMAAPITTRLIV